MKAIARSSYLLKIGAILFQKPHQMGVPICASPKTRDGRAGTPHPGPLPSEGERENPRPLGRCSKRCVSLENTWRALLRVLLAVTAGLPVTIRAADVSVTVARRDLRPLPGVTLQLAGAVNLQGVTDETGHATFGGLPAAGAVTITPSRSGFHFEPPQFAIPDLANPAPPLFAALPTATDLALTMSSDDPNPLVGGFINEVITLSNLGTEAATDVTVGLGPLPGLVLEDAQATQGVVQFHYYGTQWILPQLNPGASAEVHARCRATLPDANVLDVPGIQEMDQTDTDPLNNVALLTTHTRAAHAKLSLAMTINPATVKAGGTFPVQLTVRNDGPDDATQVAIRTYLPPGASLFASTNQPRLQDRVVIPRLAAGGQVQLIGSIFVRFSGSFTLIANATYFEQQLPAGVAWPEARSDFTVQPAQSHITLLAFTDPPNPRVGEKVNVAYVARNDGPDPVTNLKLFTSEDSRLELYGAPDPDHPPPPVPGPFVTTDVVPVGAYTYSSFSYLIKAAGDLTNYFTIEYQDQPILNGADYPELYVPIKTLPADVALSLDANPKDITAQSGEAVTIEFPVHNDGPQPARGIRVDYDSQALIIAEPDEVIHADRILRPGTSGFIDVVDPGETVRLRRHFIASIPGTYTNYAEITVSSERPDLLLPIAREAIRLQVLPTPPPDLGITVSVDKPQVNVGEYAIFIVTVTNRAAQPALGVTVQETASFDVNYAFETVRSYGPQGDDRVGSATLRTIPQIDPGTSYSMSRTVRVRKPLAIPYFARIVGVNGLQDSDIPLWFATNQVTGIQVASDIASAVVPDRTNVKTGDLVNFAIISSNLSSYVASHVKIYTGESAGFQVLDYDLGGYGYFYDYARPTNLESGAQLFSEWVEIPHQEAIFSWLSTYAVGSGQLTVGAQSGALDQLDPQAANDLSLVQINSAAASASVSLHQTTFPANPSVGDLVLFLAEIRNEGPDRVTGLSLVETSSTNLDQNVSVNGTSGDYVTSIFDPLVRLPALEPGQNFIWQRTFLARSAGNASHDVRVTRFDQTALAPLPDNEATLTIEPAQADLEVQFLSAPTVAQMNIPTLVVVRVRNLGPAVATGVGVAVSVPSDALTLGSFHFGPRASLDFLTWNQFLTSLRPGESATASFYVTPTRTGTVTGFVHVQESDQIDPNAANDTVSFTLNVGDEPPIPPILHVRKVRTDFFDHTPIAEIEIDQEALNRLGSFSIFSLEASSNLQDWEFLTYVGGLFSSAPVTFTDHANPGVTTRVFRLRD